MRSGTTTFAKGGDLKIFDKWHKAEFYMTHWVKCSKDGCVIFGTYLNSWSKRSFLKKVFTISISLTYHLLLFIQVMIC